MDKSRREKHGRFGTHPVWVTRTFGANPITANTTTDYHFAAPPVSCVIGGGSLHSVVVAANADGTTLAYLCKYRASDDSVVVLTSALNVEGVVTKEGTRFTVLGTLTDAEQTILAGDTLLVRFINNSAAIDTQPTELTVTAELFVKE